MVRGRPVNPSYRYSAAALQTSNVGRLVLELDVSALAHHSNSVGGLSLELSIDGRTFDVSGFGTLSLELSIDGKAWRTFFASSALSIPLAVAATASPVFSANASLSIPLLADARAQMVYASNSALSLDPIVVGYAYRPTVTAVGALSLIVDMYGLVARGTSSIGRLELPLIVLSETTRVRRSSSDFMFSLEIAATANHPASPAGVRASGNLRLQPSISGMANA